MISRTFLSIAAIALFTVTQVHAGDAPDQTALPGVDGSYSIVAPAPEPDDLPADPGATKRAGNWELTVSGYVWVQVGASSPVRGN